MQVLSNQFSFTFCFRFEKLVIFTSRYGMEAFLIFFILLLFDSSVFAKHSVMPYLLLFVFVNKCYASLSL